MRPDTTIESAAARRLGGARSPTRGSMSWGVTVVMAQMKDIAVKAARLLVTQRPILDGLLAKGITLYIKVKTRNIVAIGK
jgi:hypothetical protein